MGISFFSCDECGMVMNDCGGYNYSRLEFCEHKVTKDGIYCEDCASRIKYGKIPKLSYLTIVFCLKTQNLCEYYKFPELDKSTLLQLIQKLQSCETASVREIAKDESMEAEFENPQKIYEYFVTEFINELNGDKYSWFSAPIWPNVESRNRKLESDIVHLNQKMVNLQDKLLHKQKKLSSL
jgi:hypothetical protein